MDNNQESRDVGHGLVPDYQVPDRDYYEMLIAQEKVLRWKAELRACEAERAIAQYEMDMAMDTVELMNETIVRNATDGGKYEIEGDFVLSRTDRAIARNSKTKLKG